MAEHIDAIIKIRRGLDGDRRTIVFDQGEIAYSSDIKRVFIGDGTTVGASLVGNLNTIGTSPSPYAVNKDLFYDKNTCIMYMLSNDSGANALVNYARVTPDGDGISIKFENGKYSIKDDYITGNLDNRYVNLTGDTMTGSLCIKNTTGNSLEVNNPIKVDYITSTQTLSIQKPTIQIFNNYSEVVNQIDVTTASSIPTIDLNKGNNFVINLHDHLSGFNITNCPNEGASFGIIIRYKANNKNIDWRLKVDGGTFLTPKWQMGKLPITSKSSNNEDAFAFVYMAGQWYCFISGVNMLSPVTTVT